MNFYMKIYGNAKIETFILNYILILSILKFILKKVQL